MKKLCAYALLAALLVSNSAVVAEGNGWVASVTSLPKSVSKSALSLPKTVWNSATKTTPRKVGSAAAVIVAGFAAYKLINESSEVRKFLGLDTKKKSKKVKPANVK